MEWFFKDENRPGRPVMFIGFGACVCLTVLGVVWLQFDLHKAAMLLTVVVLGPPFLIWGAITTGIGTGTGSGEFTHWRGIVGVCLLICAVFGMLFAFSELLTTLDLWLKRPG
jgi:hypothetical protein